MNVHAYFFAGAAMTRALRVRARTTLHLDQFTIGQSGQKPSGGLVHQSWVDSMAERCILADLRALPDWLEDQHACDNEYIGDALRVVCALPHERRYGRVTAIVKGPRPMSTHYRRGVAALSGHCVTASP
jgi:hypothetical protein